MKFGKSWDVLNKLSKIDQLAVADHYYLTENDEVWYFGEYSSGKGFQYSPANQLVTNLKHGVEHRGTPRWRYKAIAITQVGCALSKVIGVNSADTFVPIPPSVVKSDPTYDSRNLDILSDFNRRVGGTADVRELLYQRHSTRRSHLSEERVTQQELIDAYCIDESLAAPAPQSVVLFDDVLTTGNHFLAARHVIQQRFGNIRVAGLVVCRRKLPNPFEAPKDL